MNFFKHLVHILVENGHKVDITYLNRGKLPEILKKEFKSIPLKKIGKHRGSFISIIFEANILRFFIFLKHLFTNKYDICLSVASFPLGFVAKLKGIPNIQFTDDLERKLLTWLLKISSSSLVVPLFKIKSKKTRVFEATNEWAYLSPQYFKPDINALNKYALTPFFYIFIREVDTHTFNYYKQHEKIADITGIFPDNIQVVLSLENKTHKHRYPGNWIILEEPVADIHSLMYYSKVVISTGDSMAREGAVLGVPSFYCGIRNMKINKALIKKGLLNKVQMKELPELIKQNRYDDGHQRTIRAKLKEEWVDVNKYMQDIIITYG